MNGVIGVEQERPEQMVRRLMAAVKCNVCGSTYEPDRIKVLGHKDELWFLTVTCDRCHTQGLVAALLKSDGQTSATSATFTRISVPGKVSSLEEEAHPEIEAPTLSDPVTPDDVLEMHQFLQHFDGDFARLFGSSGRWAAG